MLTSNVQLSAVHGPGSCRFALTQICLLLGFVAKLGEAMENRGKLQKPMVNPIVPAKMMKDGYIRVCHGPIFGPK